MAVVKIAISGAGIAGPTVAHWLHRAGHVPTLIEHAPAEPYRLTIGWPMIYGRVRPTTIRTQQPDAPLFPGRYGRAEKLPDGLTRVEIEPPPRSHIDPQARRNRAGEVDRRHTKADPHPDAIRCAPSFGYKWSVPVNRVVTSVTVR